MELRQEKEGIQAIEKRNKIKIIEELRRDKSAIKKRRDELRQEKGVSKSR